MASVKTAAFVFRMSEDSPRVTTLGDRYAHLYLRLGTIGDDRRWRGGLDADFAHFEGIEVSCQGDPDHDGAYAWAVKSTKGYGGMKLGEAEDAVRALKTIDKGMTALVERLGYPKTFGEYAARVADVLSVRFTIGVKDRQYTESGREEIENRCLADRIDEIVAGWWSKQSSAS